MKNIFRVIGFGLAIIAFSTINGFAQNPCDDTFEVKEAEYKKFKENLKSVDENIKGKNVTVALEKAKATLQIGNSFNTKYATCGDETKPIVDYIKGKIPAIEKYIKETERNLKFDNGIKNKVWADAFSAGKEIIADAPDKPIALDIALTLASIGFDRAAIDKSDTFNAETIAMAELAISKINAGIVSVNYGLSYGTAETSYVYKTTKFADGKQNALGWMNYIIGYIKYVRQSKQKDALPYYYAATKYNSETKNYTDIYVAFGVYYFEELKKIDEVRLAELKANENKDNEKTLAMWDLEKGYFDRAIDAYARAYNIAKANATTAKPEKKVQATEYKDSLYKDLQKLYKDRFTKLDGLDAYIVAQTSKPLPDPMSEVMPVKEVVPTTTTTSTTTPTTTTTVKPTTTTKPVTTTKPTTKPVTTTKPSSSTTTPKKPTKTTKKKSSR